MYVKALKPFTELVDGIFFSPAAGAIFQTTSEKGSYFISKGLAEEYTLITPTGNITITENGTGIDVAQYATATVNVGTYTVSYDVNGGTGTVASSTVIAGGSVTLPDGTGITPPTDKTFAGWATTSSAEAPDVESPYTPHSTLTLYAVYTETPTP